MAERQGTRDREIPPDIHYHLGRALFEVGSNLSGAVSELRLATSAEPANARAQLYLGQAIRALVERETLIEARQALQRYLDAGAPAGRAAEVRSFLAKGRGE